MKVPKASAIAVALFLAPFFASAQSRGLDLRIQVGVEKCRPRQSNFIPRPPDRPLDDPDLIVQPDFQIAPQIRMVGELPGARGLYYEVGGRLESLSPLDYNREYNGFQIDARDVEVSYSYFGVGVAYMFCTRWGLSLGLHLEGRLERIETSGPVYIEDAPPSGDQATVGRLDGGVSYLRPWGRASMDFTFNNYGRLRPFIGAEMAMPLMERQQKNSLWALDQPQEGRLLESMAPDRSVACYIGFRI